MASSELDAFGDVGAILKRVVASGRVSPSYLFEGSDAEGAREVALAFAAALLGADEGGAKGDRTRRLVHSLEHPDLHVLGKDKPTVISVAALTAQLERAYQKPVEGDRQVFVVDPADAMEPEGIARYLKALEEPPDGTVYLLVSTNPDRLPATVLSRVRRLRLPPLSVEAIGRRLVADGVGEDVASRAAHWGSGSLARARRIASCGIEGIVGRLVHTSPESGGAARAAEHALQALERAAAERAETEGSTAAEMRRQYLRELLADGIHILAVEARDGAAGRETRLLGRLSPGRSLRLLEELGGLGAGVASNVTPAVVLLEVVRIVGYAT